MGMAPLSQAAETCGVDRKTLARWVREGRITKTAEQKVGNLTATLVDLAEVRREARKITRGRPRQDGKRA